jgi:hypothetical protein
MVETLRPYDFDLSGSSFAGACGAVGAFLNVFAKPYK